MEYLGTMTTTNCPECGESYKRIGNHWQHNPSHIHSFTDKQDAIIRGLILGDGHIDKNGKNAYVIVASTQKRFLEWLSLWFPVISRDVSLSKTTDELIAQNTESEWVKTPEDDADYNDLYRWETSRHRDFNDYSNSVDSVNHLCALSLKVYYVSDGTLAKAGSHHRPQFRVTDDVRAERIADLIRDVGFTVTVSPGNIFIKQGETDRFFEYIGNPIPGFEDKWV